MSRLPVAPTMAALQQPKPDNSPMVSAWMREREVWLEDVPEHYRRWRLGDYPENVRAALVPFLARQRPSVYLHGVTGCRKTSVAVGLLAAWRTGYRDYDGGWGQFVTPPDFRAAMLDLNPGGTGKAKLKAWQTAPVLVLDDLGALRATPHAHEQQLHLVLYRYDRNRPLIVTSNLRPAELAAKLDGRIASRLCEGIVLDLGNVDKRTK